ncbi:urotensin-2 receptor [Alligator mississippiensis]|uniref:Urotensin-2 receptor-like n=1 Tax=Alligator mississippiensis TaxID=8496 RepID=A0A151NMU3_ALLMI|nr:urotensin-2 receptor [Alligator mississippiensis]KYO38094.1 urotensin-2 receptor-like [Alligator mississippiensis]
MGTPSNLSAPSNGSLEVGEAPGDSGVGAATLGAALSLLCAVGVAGNVYTLAVARAAGSSLHTHIVNLALADLLYLGTAPFIVHTGLAKDWQFGEAGCRLLLGLDLLTMHASSFLLALLSTERYQAVAQPFRAAHRSHQCRYALAAASWAAATVLALPMMLMVRLEERTGTNGRTRYLCTPAWQEEHYRAYLTVLFGTSMVGPGLVIGCLYGRLARTYWLSQTRGMLAGAGARRAPEPRVFLLILAIVLAFWACFLPFWLWQLVPLYSPGTATQLLPTTEISINHLVTCLTYSNSCINPFLYTLLTRSYRQRRRAQGLRGLPPHQPATRV